MVLSVNECANALYNANHRELHVSNLMGFCYYFFILQKIWGISTTRERGWVAPPPPKKKIKVYHHHFSEHQETSWFLSSSLQQVYIIGQNMMLQFETWVGRGLIVLQTKHIPFSPPGGGGIPLLKFPNFFSSVRCVCNYLWQCITRQFRRSCFLVLFEEIFRRRKAWDVRSVKYNLHWLRTSRCNVFGKRSFVKSHSLPSAIVMKRFVQRSRDWISILCCASDTFGTEIWGGGGRGCWVSPNFCLGDFSPPPPIPPFATPPM